MLVRPSGLLGTRGDQQGLGDDGLPAAPKAPNVPAPRTQATGVDESGRRSGSHPSKAGERRPRPLVRAYWQRAAAACGKLALLAPAVALPFVVNSGNLFDYGLFTLLYALLALGLNVVVGFAGLLDLGYVAFFGFGAYSTRSSRRSHEVRALATGRPRSRSRVIVIGTRAASGSLLGVDVAAPARGLPRDRHALLRPGVRRVREQRRSARDHGRLQRDRARSIRSRFFGYKLDRSTKGYYYFLARRRDRASSSRSRLL